MNHFKRVKRKLVASLMVLAMLVSVATVPAAAGTPDDIEDHWAQQRIQSWLHQNLASGYPDGTFRPDDMVTRAEFVAFMNRAFDVPDTLQTPGFVDVSEEDWHYEYVSVAVQEELLTGYPDDTFRPDNPITREEAAVIVDRLIELGELDTVDPFVDEDEISGWAEEGVDAISAVKIMTGYPDGTFRPGDPITRAETISTLDRGLEYEIPPAAFDVTFYVVDEEEEALQGADVVLNDYTETTDAEGQAVFEDVETGYYEYTVSKEDYLSVEDEINVDEDIVVEVELSVAVTVENEDELDAALEKENVEKITFADDIEADITAERPLTIDFDEYTLEGDVEYSHDEEGTSKLSGTADPSIDGDLTVDTPEASFVNNVVISGDINVEAVAPDSWTENADDNYLVINASNVTITIKGNPDGIEVSEDGEDINISVEADVEVEIDIDGDAENVTVDAEEGAEVTLTGDGAEDATTEGDGDVEVEEPDPTPSPSPSPDPDTEDFIVDVDEGESTLEADEGYDFSINVTVTNDGDAEGTQDITATVDGTEVASEEVADLEAGDDTTINLTFEAEAKHDEETVEVESDDDSETTSELSVIDDEVEVSAITVDPTEMTLYEGGSTGIITATVEPDNATNDTVNWSSSDPSIAIVSNGVVTPVAEGTATITAGSADGPEGTVTITVEPNDAQKIEADKTALDEDAIKGNNPELDNVTHNLDLIEEGAVHQSTISWASDDEAVVATDGTVTRPDAGDGNETVELTATITNGVASDTEEFTVTVLQQEPIEYASTADVDFDVTVDFGTEEAVAVAELAETVEVTGTESETADATIAWAIAGYDGTTAGDYTSTGDLSLPEGWEGDPADAEATVTVKFEVLKIVSVPGKTTAGDTIEGPPRVLASDEYGNPLEDIDVTVSEDGGYSFDEGTTTQTTGTDGIAIFDDLVIEAAGDYQLVFDAEDITCVADSDTFTVEAADAYSVDVSDITRMIIAGSGFDIAGNISNLKDKYGNMMEDGDYEVTVISNTEDDGDAKVVFDSSIEFKDGEPAEPTHSWERLIEITLKNAGGHTLTVNVGEVSDTVSITVKHAHVNGGKSYVTAEPDGDYKKVMTAYVCDPYGNPITSLRMDDIRVREIEDVFADTLTKWDAKNLFSVVDFGHIQNGEYKWIIQADENRQWYESEGWEVMIFADSYGHGGAKIGSGEPWMFSLTP